MEVEFKEKTFEKYFGQELARLTNVTYPPDQVDEGALGFDDAFLLSIHHLRLLLPYRRRARWSRFVGIKVSDLEHVADELSRRMPRYRFNLFVQYKRPEYIESHRAAEWENWRQPYYRYDTTPHQQVLLEKIEDQSHGRAATVYASPAFWRSTDLFRYAQNQAIVRNSNIASIGLLQGHSRYTYLVSGTEGQAHSESIEVSSPTLEEIVDKGLANEGMPLTDHLRRVAKLIKEVVATSEVSASLFGTARAAIAVDVPPVGSLFDALVTIEAFSDAFAAAYYAMG